MSRGLAWTIHLATGVLGLSGLVWAWMRYLLEPVDEFSILHHPAEPDVRVLHLLVAPAALFLWGVVWRSHVWARWRVGVQQRRRTGLVLMLLVLPMVASGYGLQVTDEPAWREAWIWIHGVSGTLFALVYLAHQFGSRLVPRRGARGDHKSREAA